MGAAAGAGDKADALSQLSRFLADQGGDREDIPPVLRAIERAIKKSAGPCEDTKEIRDRADRLAGAAERLSTAMEHFLAEVELSEPLWLLFFWAGAPLSNDEVRTTVQAAYTDKIGTTAVRVGNAARAVQKSWRRKIAHDEPRKILGFELATIYKLITGKDSTFSNSGDWDRPGTAFGVFAKLAIAAFGPPRTARLRQICREFPSFVKSAVEAQRSALGTKRAEEK